MSTVLDFGRDINGYNAFSPEFSGTGEGVLLTLDAEQHFTVPEITDAIYGSKRYMAIFSIEPGTIVFIAKNATATAFSGTIGATVTELNPTSRTVRAGDVLSLLTKSATAYVGIKLLAMP